MIINDIDVNHIEYIEILDDNINLSGEVFTTKLKIGDIISIQYLEKEESLVKLNGDEINYYVYGLFNNDLSIIIWYIYKRIRNNSNLDHKYFHDKAFKYITIQEIRDKKLKLLL